MLNYDSGHIKCIDKHNAIQPDPQCPTIHSVVRFNVNFYFEFKNLAKQMVFLFFFLFEIEVFALTQIILTLIICIWIFICFAFNYYCKFDEAK